ncbi:MAG: transporter-like protein [Rhodocyclaceae bacterium]|nr:transporter-like protein [Rhodocyclaceae bacterium]
MTAALELHGVAKRYPLAGAKDGNGVAALRDVSLSLPAGAFVAIEGPSGSGKSTLLHICGLIDRFDSGEYWLQGQNVADLDEASRTRLRRRSIGFIFQGFHLIPVLTVAENVAYALWLLGVNRQASRERVEEILEAVGLATQANQRPDQLSGGQRQRAAIARALVKGPQVVIADEPTANLDTATAQSIIELMHSLGAQSGTTFLIATHDGRMSARCDTVYRLADGVLQ